MLFPLKARAKCRAVCHFYSIHLVIHKICAQIAQVIVSILHCMLYSVSKYFYRFTNKWYLYFSTRPYGTQEDSALLFIVYSCAVCVTLSLHRRNFLSQRSYVNCDIGTFNLRLKSGLNRCKNATTTEFFILSLHINSDLIKLFIL